jgi:hypothetical protein
MIFPEKLKKELVLSFKFRRVGAAWKCDREKPNVLRLVNHDCSQEYRDPQLTWSRNRSMIEARVYDDIGIDITNPDTLLGDWAQAKSRCEELL